MIAAFGGLLDENLQKAIEGRTASGIRGGLSSDALDNLERDKRMEAMKSGGVQASNYLLNDILGTLKRGIITYSYMIADAGATDAEGNLSAGLPGLPPAFEKEMRGCPFAARCRYCMPVCRKCAPQPTDFSPTHQASCWLNHPMAPQHVREGGSR